MSMLILTSAFLITAGGYNQDDQTVVTPRDNAPFAVQSNDVVRLIGRGISGSGIEIQVSGTAKLTSTNVVREVAEGRPVIGSTVKEFNLKPTGAGTVTATITVTPPQPNSQATIVKYQFQVR